MVESPTMTRVAKKRVKIALCILYSTHTYRYYHTHTHINIYIYIYINSIIQQLPAVQIPADGRQLPDPSLNTNSPKHLGTEAPDAEASQFTVPCAARAWSGTNSHEQSGKRCWLPEGQCFLGPLWWINGGS